MEEKNKKDINRRDFIKIVGISAATSTAILYGCSSKGTSSSSSASAEGEIPTDKMTYRTSPTTGDRVSLLGYGCMRWPLKPAPDGKGEVIDQDELREAVIHLINTSLLPNYPTSLRIHGHAKLPSKCIINLLQTFRWTISIICCFMASVWVEWTPLKDDIWIMECLTF